MTLELDESETALEEDDLAALERSFGAALPAAFRAQYLAWNGGYPQGNRVRVGHGAVSINGFVPIRHGRLPVETLARDCHESWPELGGHLPFAYDDGGNLFLLSLRPGEESRVLLWYHDERALEPVSATFAAFLEAIFKEA